MTCDRTALKTRTSGAVRPAYARMVTHLEKKMKAIARLLSAAAVSTAILVAPAPPAAAAPLCDWSTDAGAQACMGGGPFGGGDTYGPTGEAGFVQDNKRSFPQTSPDVLLRAGYKVCEGIANGGSPSGMKAELMKSGMDETSAGAFVMSAQMYLCP